MRQKRNREAPRDEIRLNGSDGSLDEVVVAHPDFFHLEQMGEGSWWIGVTKQDKELHIWLEAAEKGHLMAYVTENEWGAVEVITDQHSS